MHSVIYMLLVYCILIFIARRLVERYKISLTTIVFIEVPVPSRKNVQSCIWVLVVSSLSLYTIFFMGILEMFRQCGMFCFSLYDIKPRVKPEHICIVSIAVVILYNYSALQSCFLK